MKTREEWSADVALLADSMLSYMNALEDEEDYGDGDQSDPLEAEAFTAYTTDDIDECSSFLEEYLDMVLDDPPPSREEILTFAERTVRELNQLNRRCEHQLIETDQREMICDILIGAATQTGQMGPDAGMDFTEEWREW